MSSAAQETGSTLLVICVFIRHAPSAKYTHFRKRAEDNKVIIAMSNQNRNQKRVHVPRSVIVEATWLMLCTRGWDRILEMRTWQQLEKDLGESRHAG